MTPSPFPRSISSGDYCEHAPMVDRTLAALGIPTGDRLDLRQEVFAVAQRRLRSVEVADLTAWLKGIARRLAAAHRRKTRRRSELLSADPERQGDVPSLRVEPSGDESFSAHLGRMLAALTETERDLLALHDGGSLPLADLARLFDCDRKTIRKRLVKARGRAAALLPKDLYGELVPPIRHRGGDWLDFDPPTDHLVIDNRAPCPETVASTRGMGLATFAQVVVVIWRAGLSVESFDAFAALIETSCEVARGRRPFVLLLESGGELPSFEARKRGVNVFHLLRGRCSAMAVKVGARVPKGVGSTMIGMSLLADAHFPLSIFDEDLDALSWACRHAGRATEDEWLRTTGLLRVIDQLRGEVEQGSLTPPFC